MLAAEAVVAAVRRTPLEHGVPPYLTKANALKKPKPAYARAVLGLTQTNVRQARQMVGASLVQNWVDAASAVGGGAATAARAEADRVRWWDGARDSKSKTAQVEGERCALTDW